MKILSESGEKYAQIKYCSDAKTVLKKLVDFDVRGQEGMDFLTGKNIIDWTHILVRSDCLKLKCFNFVSYKHAAFHYTVMAKKHRHLW